MSKTVLMVLMCLSFSAAALPRQTENLVRGKKAEDLLKSLGRAKVGHCKGPNDCERIAKEASCSVQTASKEVSCSVTNNGGHTNDLSGEDARKLNDALKAAGAELNSTADKKTVGPVGVKCVAKIEKKRPIFHCWLQHDPTSPGQALDTSDTKDPADKVYDKYDTDPE